MSFILKKRQKYGGTYMDLLNSRVKRNEDIAWRVIEGEALVVDPKGQMIYPLNEAGTRIWELIDGKNTCNDIVLAISGEFEADAGDIKKDVLEFTEDLLKKELALRCD